MGAPQKIEIEQFVNGTYLGSRAVGHYRLYSFKCDTKFSISEGPLEYLTELFPKQGLVRMQVNDPGVIDLYFVTVEEE